MNKILLLLFYYAFIINILLCILCILYIIYNTYYKQEGFNTYFRKTLRPHIRNVTDAHKTITYQFNTKFIDFKRSLGFT